MKAGLLQLRIRPSSGLKLSLIVLLFVIVQLGELNLIAKCKSGTDQQQRDNNSVANNRSQKTKGNPSTTPVHSSKTATNHQLVPPPPPVQPSYLSPYFAGPSYFLMGGDLSTQLKGAKEQLAHAQEEMKEKQDKSEHFKSLYEEGVVSRHELEAVQKEAQEAQKETDICKDNVAQLEAQTSAAPKSISPAKSAVAKSAKGKK